MDLGFCASGAGCVFSSGLSSGIACCSVRHGGKSAFVKRCASRARRALIVNCESHSAQDDNDEAPKVLKKFDPNSDTNTFGRDPKKETEFWMGAARSVLDSDEVRQAIAKHEQQGGDGLTDEQRAYMEFIKSLDTNTSQDPS